MDVASSQECTLDLDENQTPPTENNRLLLNCNDLQFLSISHNPPNSYTTKPVSNLKCSTDDIDDTLKHTSINDNSTSSLMVYNDISNINEHHNCTLENSLYDPKSTIRAENVIGHITNALSKISPKASGIDHTSSEYKDQSKNDDNRDENVSSKMETRISRILGYNLNTGSRLITSPKGLSRQRSQMINHQNNLPGIMDSEFGNIVETPYTKILRRPETHLKVQNNVKRETMKSEHVSNDVITVTSGTSRNDFHVTDKKSDLRTLLPRPIKLYQLLSTQSEDHGNNSPRLFDRRISLQIPSNSEEKMIPKNSDTLRIDRKFVPMIEVKKLIHSDSVPIIKIPSSNTINVGSSKYSKDNDYTFNPKRKLSLSDELHTSADDRRQIVENPICRESICSIKPIYPNCPYSPYSSPQGSPKIHRRRPLRESRRVSIDSRHGDFQLNQYKLLSNIGQYSNTHTHTQKVTLHLRIS